MLTSSIHALHFSLEAILQISTLLYPLQFHWSAKVQNSVDQAHPACIVWDLRNAQCNVMFFSAIPLDFCATQAKICTHLGGVANLQFPLYSLQCEYVAQLQNMRHRTQASFFGSMWRALFGIQQKRKTIPYLCRCM